MREIKFRGKTESGIWKIGSLLIDETQKSYYIIDNEDGSGRVVLEETIGQYTGLHDKNEKEIYEGDIISDLDYGIMICKFINGSFVWQSIKNELYIKFFTYIPIVEVIGNIYDNKDLLEKGKEE